MKPAYIYVLCLAEETKGQKNTNDLVLLLIIDLELIKLSMICVRMEKEIKGNDLFHLNTRVQSHPSKNHVYSPKRLRHHIILNPEMHVIFHNWKIISHYQTQVSK